MNGIKILLIAGSLASCLTTGASEARASKGCWCWIGIERGEKLIDYGSVARYRDFEGGKKKKCSEACARRCSSDILDVGLLCEKLDGNDHVKVGCFSVVGHRDSVNNTWDFDAYPPPLNCHHQEPEPRWTVWLNRDAPSGTGDFETLRDFLKERPGDVCQQPRKIECRRRSDHRLVTSGTQSNGEVVACELLTGGYCYNNKQPPGVRCSDYEVRFACPQ